MTSQTLTATSVRDLVRTAPTEAIDCCNLSPGGFADLMARATRLGAHDATGLYPAKSEVEVLAALGVVGWRGGHRKHLRAAYRAGRFHVEAMGK